MIGQYMSDDQLVNHVNRQMTFFHKKYEPEEEQVGEEKVIHYIKLPVNFPPFH